MTNTERIQRIKNSKLNKFMDLWLSGDADWLIKQAEKLEAVTNFLEEISRGPYPDSDLKSLHAGYQASAIHFLKIINEGNQDE